MDKKIWKSIIRIAIPIVIQGVIFQVQSLTDKAFLGNINAKYISALGAAQFPFNTTLDSLAALCTGIIIIVSHLIGANKKNKVNEYVKSAIFYNTIISLSLFVLWFGFSHVILDLLSVDKSIRSLCINYISICSFYFLIYGIDCSLQAMLLGLGNTQPIMISGILKVALNIFISWVLIFGHFGFPSLVLIGAAIGTLTANIISSIYIIFYCFLLKRREYQLHIHRIEWVKISSFLQVIKLGIPTGMEYFMWNASNLVLIRFLNSFGYLATTMYTLTFGIEIIIFAIFSGTAKATLTLMGRSIGANNNKRADQQFISCMIINLLIVIVAIITFNLFPLQILSIFTKDIDTVWKTVPYLIFTAFIMIPKSFNVIIGNGIRAYGNTKWMFYSQVIGSIFVITSSYILIELFKLHIIAIYITLLLDETIRSVINYAYYYSHYKTKVLT